MTNQDDRMRRAQGPHHGVETPRGLTSVARSDLLRFAGVKIQATNVA
jgi:hypothetical protein